MAKYIKITKEEAIRLLKNQKTDKVKVMVAEKK